MSNEVIAAVIGQQLKQLKLPGIGRAYIQVGRQAGWRNPLCAIQSMAENGGVS